MTRRKPIPKKRSKLRRGPVRDPKYLTWLHHKFGCIICDGGGIYPVLRSRVSVWNPYGPTEAAHVGARGLSQKCSDRETIPLCARHHRTGSDSHHKLGKKFWAYHGLDRDKLIAEYNRLYHEETGL